MAKSLSIRNRLIFSILSITVIMLLIFFFINYSFSEKAVVKQIREKTSEKVNSVAQTFRAFIKEKARTAWAFCQSPLVTEWMAANETRNPTPEDDPVYGKIGDYFKRITSGDTDITYAFLGSKKSGMYYDFSGAKLSDDYDITKRSWFIQLEKEKKPSYTADRDIRDGALLITYRHPILDKDQNFLGAGGVDVKIENISEFLGQLDIFESGYAIMVQRDGKIIYHPDKNIAMKKNLEDFKDDGDRYIGMNAVAAHLLSGKSGFERLVYNGQDRYFAYTFIEELGWSLILSIDSAEINEPVTTLTRNSMIMLVLTIGIMLAAIFWIARTISRPIVKISEMVKDISEGEGDLTKTIEIDRRDEIGNLAEYFNAFVDKIRMIVSRVKDAALEITNATHDVARGSETLALRTNEQVASITETNATLQAFTDILQNADQRTQSTQDVLEQFHNDIVEHKELMANVTSTMAAIDSSSKEIDNIVDVINDISFQTNLLALNAAVEAARAGDAGRGFAVVATEVRNLAQKTAESSRTIQDIVSKNVETAQQGKELVAKAADYFNTILETVGHIMDAITEITAGSKEQTAGIGQIDETMDQLEKVSSQNATLVEQFSATSKSMEANAEELQELVERFKLDE